LPEIVIDGRPFTAGGNLSLLEACLALGFDLPYFCWHPALGSVGACRQCAIKQFKDEHDQAAGKGRLVMACMTPVAPGARISLADPEATAFRKSVIEGMMLNHPHDCPVCDEGGQCHLQDMTVMTGHAYRRYRFDKRTFHNQYLGPLVNHEMNRCIQCYRCVRFYRDYAGGTDLDAFGISNRVFFGRARDGVLESEFSGNLAEVCPTGVFTDATLKRHYTRKWDLRWTPSICAHCSLGCNLSPGERYGSVRAVVNRYHHDINGYFLCDRGRFGYEALESPARLRAPRLHGAPVSPEDATAHLTKLLRGALADPPGRCLGIGSPRASLESNFALRQLVGPERFFAGVADAELALLRRSLELLRRFPPPTLREVESCDAVLILGEDVTQTAPRLALALRQAARQQPMREISDPLKIPRWLDHPVREALQDAHGPLFQFVPWATKLDPIATANHHAAPDDLARLALDPDSSMALALAAAERPLIVAGLSLGSPALLEAAAALCARFPKARISLVLPACNSLGLALLDPRPLGEALDLIRFDGISTVILLESSLELEGLSPEHLILLNQVETPLAQHAELVLPAADAIESEGTFINNEGRAQRFFPVSPPSAAIRPSWQWLAPGLSLDALLTQLAAAFPELAPVRDAAPPADFREAGQKFPRETHRFSGRTAISANLAVSEPKPADDPNAPLSFTMEGYPSQPPAALTSFFWSPAWNSPQAQLTYHPETRHPGIRLFK
jgi:NADH-quinone oxidoreductase subunit G